RGADVPERRGSALREALLVGVDVDVAARLVPLHRELALVLARGLDDLLDLRGRVPAHLLGALAEVGLPLDVQVRGAGGLADLGARVDQLALELLARLAELPADGHEPAHLL